MSIRRTVGRAIRPVRRFASWFALVDERGGQISAPPPPPPTAKAASETLLEARRDLETANARLTTEIQRLAEEVARIRTENAAILRLLSEPRRGEKADGETPTETGRSVPAAALMQELERGPREAVLQKFSKYKELIRGRSPVADLCCGRGEFLECAEWVDIAAYGVDTNPDAVEHCRGLGLDARLEDPLQHLAGLQDGSLGGVFCVQLLEYLPPQSVEALVRETARVLKPDGIAIFETPNPECLATLGTFWADPRRERPVPAGWLAALARSAGLEVRDVTYSGLSADARRLPAASPDTTRGRETEALNHLIEDLNAALFDARDYTLVALKPA